MTPIEQLAAARLNVVGPYLPAKEEWLKGWTGPVEWLDTFRDPNGRWTLSAYGDGGMANGVSAERIRLDARRLEVRDLLVRLGCPEWAREVPAAVWAWGMGVAPRQALPLPSVVNTRSLCDTYGGRTLWWCDTPESRDYFIAPVGPEHSGWACMGRVGMETGDEALDCIRVAGLAERMIVREPDGCYVPLADGGIGWWANG